MSADTRKLAKLVHTIGSHTSDVNGVAFCGKTLATCSGDKTIRLWSTDDFTELPSSPLLGHTYYVHCCVFSPFGTSLASCSTDGKVILWDTKTGDKLATFEHPSKMCIRVCRYSPNSKLLVTGSDDERVALWDLSTMKYIRSLDSHEGTVSACAFSPDSMLVVSGSSNGDLCVWDAFYGHGKCLTFEIDAHDLGVTGCDFSPTYGSAGMVNQDPVNAHFLLASCGNDNNVKLWDVLYCPGNIDVTLRLRDTLAGHSMAVMSCCFTANGKLLASGSGDKTVRLWDPLRGEPVYTIEGHSRYVTCCAFSGDGSLLASGSNDRTIMVWKIVTEEDLTDQASIIDVIESEEDVFIPKNKKPLSTWTTSEVVTWIGELGLGQYHQRFEDNHIDGQELVTLRHETLQKDLGIDALGHRNKILRAIQHIQSHPIIQVKEAEEQGVPDEYLCPITREIMKEPVLASDGYTYERSSIIAWMNTGKTRSPMTNAVLPNMTLIPNRSLKMLIQRYMQGH